jgi:hypothetical protein
LRTDVSQVAAGDAEVLFLSCAESVEKMPELWFRKSRVPSPEELHGIGEDERVEVVGDLGGGWGTVTVRRLVQTAHLSRLLSLTGSSRKRYFLGSMRRSSRVLRQRS